MKYLFIFMFFLAIPYNLWAEDKIFLYGDYYYGMSSEEFLKAGPAQCDNYSDGKMICNHQKVSFAAMQWTQFFEFKNNKLTCVAFGQPLSQSAFTAAMVWFQDDGYIPINAKTDNASINFLYLYDKKQNNKFNKELGPFTNNLPSSNTFTSNLIKSSIIHEHKTMDNIPADTIMATLGGSKSQRLFFVCFELASNYTIYPLK